MKREDIEVGKTYFINEDQPLNSLLTVGDEVEVLAIRPDTEYVNVQNTSENHVTRGPWAVGFQHLSLSNPNTSSNG